MVWSGGLTFEPDESQRPGDARRCEELRRSRAGLSLRLAGVECTVLVARTMSPKVLMKRP